MTGTVDEKVDDTGENCKRAAVLFASHRIDLEEITRITRRVITKMASKALELDNGHSERDDIYELVKNNVIDLIPYAIWLGMHDNKKEILQKVRDAFENIVN